LETTPTTCATATKAGAIATNAGAITVVCTEPTSSLKVCRPVNSWEARIEYAGVFTLLCSETPHAR
jgi:hypothetical protein